MLSLFQAVQILLVDPPHNNRSSVVHAVNVLKLALAARVSISGWGEEGDIERLIVS